MTVPDLHFYFDPVCPFAWLTSKWVRIVARQRGYQVEWRFLSLRLLNAHRYPDAHNAESLEAGHTDGLRLLRVCAAARAHGGPDAVDRLYATLGERVFDSAGAGASASRAHRSSAGFVAEALVSAELPITLATAVSDSSHDDVVQAETDEALSLAGRDVGTPVLHFTPPLGAAFFGPVISRLPSEDGAAELWDNVVGIGSYPGFSELKRSLRERPQLRSFATDDDPRVGQESWDGGGRRRAT